MGFDILHIAKRILLSDQTVSLPGLGVFYLRRSPAQVDRSTHSFTPPRVDLNFKWKPETKGERLTEILISEYGLDDIAARQSLRRFADQIMDRYYAEGDTELEGLGRIYKDPNGNMIYNAEQADLIFTSSSLPSYRLSPIERKSDEDVANIRRAIEERQGAGARGVVATGALLGATEDKDPSEDSDADWDAIDEELIAAEEKMDGLISSTEEVPEETVTLRVEEKPAEDDNPHVESEIIPEPEEVIAPIVTTQVVKETPPLRAEPIHRLEKQKSSRSWLPWLLLFLLILLAYLAYLFFAQKDADPIAGQIEESVRKEAVVAQEEIIEEAVDLIEENTSENSEIETAGEAGDTEEVASEDIKTNSELVKEENNQISIDGFTPTIVDGNCIIVVGAFGRVSNADKMVRRLTGKGYSTYRVPYNGNLERIGAQVLCENAETELSKIKAEIEKTAWILH